MKKVAVYIHGKGGSADEACHYEKFLSDTYDVKGSDYKPELPWEAKSEFQKYFADNDNMTSVDTMTDFANKINAKLTTMRDGEHWFHTEEQMTFLDNWFKVNI